MMALSIFYQSRKAYGILSKLFALPSKRTLQRSMHNTNVMPGFVDTIFDALKIKTSTLEEKDKYVALVYDEMTLKTDLIYNHGLDKIEGFEDLGHLGTSQYVADNALVFMVRGLLSKWKQPLAYFLTTGTVKSDQLQQLTRKCLDQLEEIGLHVKVIICDQGSNNRSFLQTLEGVSIEKPYMIYKTRKVYIMYDPPHLLKNVRNNFMKSNYKYDQVDIRWQYIVDFFNMDKEMSVRMAPKLTEKHIVLAPFTAMRVKLATQVLSHSVAAGINTLCNLGYLTDDAVTTAEFIETFDQLFNTFNSASLKSTHKYKQAFSDESSHIPFLQSCLRFLSKVQTGENSVIPCIIGWQISIKSLLLLWNELKNCGFKYLLTNRLNQDCLENLFSAIRFKGGFRDNPDSQQFRAAFRHVIVDKLFVHSTTANCQFDTDKMLLDISNVTIKQKKGKELNKHPVQVPVQASLVAMPAPSLPKRNVVAYMAGYLIKQCPIGSCINCSELLKLANPPENSPVSDYELIKCKMHTNSSNFVFPSATFTAFVQTLETTFSCIFGGVMHTNNLMKCLCKSVENEVVELHQCGNLDCLKRLFDCVKLYMTARIHHALKVSNITKVCGHKKNRKMLKLCHQLDKNSPMTGSGGLILVQKILKIYDYILCVSKLIL